MNAKPHPSSPKLAVIIGSVREGRFADTIVQWLLPELKRLHAGPIDVIDLRDADVPFTNLGTDSPRFRERIAWADAFIFVVPEYNHSFPGPLKMAIDAAYEEWNAKPAAFVSYGGNSGGTRAVEHLRLVLAELHVVGTRQMVTFVNAWEQFDGSGRVKNPGPTSSALEKMYRELSWWARTLKDARTTSTYGQWL